MTNIDDAPPRTSAGTPDTKRADADGRSAAGIRTSAAALSERTRPVWRWLILVIIGLADVALAVPAFNAALRSWVGLSIFCAIAFSLVTVVAAATSGRELKRENRPLAIAAGLGAVAVIAGLFMLRLYAAALQGTAAAYEGSGASGDALAGELPVAIALAVLMLVTAVMAGIDGHDMTVPPDEAALRAVESSVASASTAVGEQKGVVVREKADLASGVYQLRRIDTDLAEALHALDALADDLAELARYEVARHLGDPGATSGLDIPLRP